MVRRSILAAALALAAGMPAAASAAPMNLLDAVSFALSHSQSVAQAQATLASASHQLALARENAFPTVNGQLISSLGKSNNYGGAYAAIGIPVQNVYSQNTAQVGTQYTLDAGDLSFIQMQSARASEAQARQNLAYSEDQVATTVTSAYYSVMQKRAIVAVDESDLQYQNVLVDAARVKEHAGVAAGVDVLRAQVNETKSASTLVGAKADIDNARENLAQTIGSSLDQEFTFPDTIVQPAMPEQPVDKLEATALQARPDYQAANDALIAAQLTRKGWGRELFPTVQFGASIGNQYSPTSSVQEQEELQQECLAELQPGQSPALCDIGTPLVPTVTRGIPGFWNISATSTFSLPLVDYGARHSERVSDDAAVASAQVAVTQAKTQVEIDIRQTYRAAQTALAQVDYARDEARLGTESARIAQLQYEHGIIALTDVVQAQQQSVVAQSDLVNARVTYVNAIVKLRVSLGIYDATSAVADLK
jgi:outer membrane protein TolC